VRLQQEQEQATCSYDSGSFRVPGKYHMALQSCLAKGVAEPDDTLNHPESAFASLIRSIRVNEVCIIISATRRPTRCVRETLRNVLVQR